MSTESNASRYFALGLKDLRSNKRGAIDAFKFATEEDPMMCDAWIGLMAADPAYAISATIAKGVIRSARNFGSELRRNGVGIDPEKGALGLAITIDMGVTPLNMPINDPLYARAASAAVLAQAGELAAAAEELSRLRGEIGRNAPAQRNFVQYLWLCLLGLAQRWPDVLSAGSQDSRDQLWLDGDGAVEYWQKGLLALRTRALVATGDADGALGATKDLLADQQMQIIRPSLIVTRAYALRALNRTDEAEKMLSDARAWMPERPDLQHALSGGVLELVTAESLSTRADEWDPASGQSAAKLKEDERNEQRVPIRDEALAELRSLPGMERVCQQVELMEAQIEEAQQMIELGIGDDTELRLSMTITGPPGTGKTKTATAYGRILYGLGAIARPEVLECQPADLIAGYVGQSAIKANELIDRSRGGILLIDEAPGLLNGDGKSEGSQFGKDAIVAIVARVEKDGAKPKEEKVTIILAGYDNEMDELLQSDPGLQMRFATRIRLTTYTPDQLVDIAETMAKAKGQVLTDQARDLLHAANRALAQVPTKDGKPALDVVNNARFMRKVVVEKALAYRALRQKGTLAGLDVEEKRRRLTTIEARDIAVAYDEVLQGTAGFSWDAWAPRRRELESAGFLQLEAEPADQVVTGGGDVVQLRRRGAVEFGSD